LPPSLLVQGEDAAQPGWGSEAPIVVSGCQSRPAVDRDVLRPWGMALFWPEPSLERK